MKTSIATITLLLLGVVAALQPPAVRKEGTLCCSPNCVDDDGNECWDCGELRCGGCGRCLPAGMLPVGVEL